MAIIRSRDLVPDLNEIPLEMLLSCIQEHQGGIARLDKLDDYYHGKHAILNRKLAGEDDLILPNNKLVTNHAKYITDMAVGYTLGKPVKYTGEKIEPVLEAYKALDIVSHDAELGKDLSIFGAGPELCYMTSDDVPVPRVANIDPRQMFLVVDDTVERRKLFGVHYYERRDIKNDPDGWVIYLYSINYIVQYHAADLAGTGFSEISRIQHYWGDVPINEFWNNEECQGDFEQQISLIDAYNLLQSDRVNDKEQLVDSILAIMGLSLGDNLDESCKTIQLLKKLKVLELPGPDSRAEWLTKSLNEDQVELLRKSIKDDIHQSSMVPCLTDENFAGNSSGVAMRFKLFGLEQLAQIKERFFIQGLRNRLQLFANILAVDISDVEITMTRNLPNNVLELAQIVNLLDGKVSDETLLGQLPFVENVEIELSRLAEQRKVNMQVQQAAFGFPVAVEGREDADQDE